MHRQGVWFSHSSNKNLTACKWSMKVLTRWYCSRFKLLTWYSVFVASISIFDMVSRKINALLYHLILIKIQFLLFCDRYVIWKVHHIIKYETACVLSKTTITRICIIAFNFFHIVSKMFTQYRQMFTSLKTNHPVLSLRSSKCNCKLKVLVLKNFNSHDSDCKPHSDKD